MTDRVYKVLHIFSGYGGGISSLIINLIENKTDDFRFDVMAFSYQNGEQFLERLAKSGCNAFEMPRPRVDGYKAFKSYVLHILSENHYDAIHCHITGWSMIPFYRLSQIVGISNFFLHAHTTRYDRKLDRLFPVSQINRFINYRYSDAFFTCSDLAANYIYGRYLNKRNAILIPNGIIKERFNDEITEEERENYRRELGLAPNEIVILHVGRFSSAKNHGFMIELIKKLLEQGENVKLLFVGDGELFQKVKTTCNSANLQNDIVFLGRRLDISKLMQFSDIMILPSYYEGLPTVAIECQASGTPMLLAANITKQCDMRLELLTFLPIDNIDTWVNAVIHRKGKKDMAHCLSAIEKAGFTANAAAEKYCSELRMLIDA